MIKRKWNQLKKWFKIKYYEYRITSADMDHGMLGEISYDEYKSVVEYYSKKIDELERK